MEFFYTQNERLSLTSVDLMKRGWYKANLKRGQLKRLSFHVISDAQPGQLRQLEPSRLPWLALFHRSSVEILALEGM